MFPKNKVLLYQDYVHNNGVLHRRLCETYGAENVRFCDAQDISKGILTKDIFLFVMPGGADLFYCEKLDGAANQNISSYVQRGGKYLGLCAGAYYGANAINWNNGEIAGERALKFFDGTATGPVFEFLEDNNINISWKNIVDVTIDDEIYPALYDGGPVFNVKGFGHYSNDRTCIVKQTIGKGLAILCSPHIEYRPSDLANVTYQHRNASSQWSQNNLSNFSNRYHAERDIWTRVMKEFA